MSSIDITDDAFEVEVLKSDKPVLLDFWTPWCGPCKMVGPAAKAAHADNPDKFKLVMVNIEDAPKTFESYNVKGTPTLMIMKDGEEVARKTGVMMKGMIEKWVDDNL